MKICRTKCDAFLPKNSVSPVNRWGREIMYWKQEDCFHGCRWHLTHLIDNLQGELLIKSNNVLKKIFRNWNVSLSKNGDWRNIITEKSVNFIKKYMKYNFYIILSNNLLWEYSINTVKFKIYLFSYFRGIYSVKISGF